MSNQLNTIWLKIHTFLKSWELNQAKVSLEVKGPKTYLTLYIT